MEQREIKPGIATPVSSLLIHLLLLSSNFKDHGHSNQSKAVGPICILQQQAAARERRSVELESDCFQDAVWV